LTKIRCFILTKHISNVWNMFTCMYCAAANNSIKLINMGQPIIYTWYQYYIFGLTFLSLNIFVGQSTSPNSCESFKLKSSLLNLEQHVMCRPLIIYMCYSTSWFLCSFISCLQNMWMTSHIKYCSYWLPKLNHKNLHKSIKINEIRFIKNKTKMRSSPTLYCWEDI